MSSTQAEAAAHIPEHPEEITAEWLSEVLGVPIRGVRREILGEGQGFLGDIVRLHLETDAEGVPASMVAKIPKLANRAIGELLGVYERESRFFDDFGSNVPARIPRVYYSDCDPDDDSPNQKEILEKVDALPGFTHGFVAWLGKRIAGNKNRRHMLIMEDLKDFEAGDQLAGASSEQCARVLEEFAAIHRRFWGCDTLDESFWLVPLDLDARIRAGVYRKSVKALREVAPQGLEPYIEKLRTLGGELVRRLADEAPTTLIHCDLRLDNICFDGDDIAFLDWQLVRSGPAAYDVAYFLGGALEPETSAEEEMHLLRRYHDALGVDDYAFDRFHLDYQRGLLASLAALAPTADVEIDEGRGQEMMQRWRVRLQARLENVELDRLV